MTRAAHSSPMHSRSRHANTIWTLASGFKWEYTDIWHQWSGLLFDININWFSIIIARLYCLYALFLCRLFFITAYSLHPLGRVKITRVTACEAIYTPARSRICYISSGLAGEAFRRAQNIARKMSGTYMLWAPQPHGALGEWAISLRAPLIEHGFASSLRRWRISEDIRRSLVTPCRLARVGSK